MAHDHFVYSTQHHAWWREGARGYTNDIMQAGFYTQKNAEQIARDGDGEFAVSAGIAMRIVALERYRKLDIAITEESNARHSVDDRRCTLAARTQEEK